MNHSQKVDHILAPKENLNKFLKAEIVQALFSDRNTIKWQKFKPTNPNTLKVNNALLQKSWVREKIKAVITDHLGLNSNKNIAY